MKACKSTKNFTGCGKEKPLSEFQPTKKWHSSTCKECVTKQRRENYKAKKEAGEMVNNITSMAWR